MDGGSFSADRVRAKQTPGPTDQFRRWARLSELRASATATQHFTKPLPVLPPPSPPTLRSGLGSIDPIARRSRGPGVLGFGSGEAAARASRVGCASGLRSSLSRRRAPDPRPTTPQSSSAGDIHSGAWIDPLGLLPCHSSFDWMDSPVLSVGFGFHLVGD